MNWRASKKIERIGVKNNDARHGKYARHDEASTKMQKEMVKEQEALNSKEFIGESTNGYVKATFTGDKNYAIFRSIKQSSIRKMLTCYKIC